MAIIKNPSPAGFLRGSISEEGSRLITRDFLKYLQAQETLVQTVAGLIPTLVAGANITLTAQADGSTLISSSAAAGVSILLKVNGVNNVVQTILNLLSGLGVTVTDNGSGGVTIKAALKAGSGITLTDDGAGSLVIASSGGGSPALTMPAEFSVAGSGTPAIVVTKAVEAANLAWLGPLSGAAAAPTFRALDILDLPSAILVGKLRGVIYSPNANSILNAGIGDQAIQILGTFTYTAPTATELATGKLTAGAGLGNQASVYHSNVRGVSRGALKYYYCRAALGNIATANWWAGITSVNPGSTLMQVTPTTQNMVVFAFIPSVIANNFAIVSCDASGSSTVADSGIVADTNFHDFLILFSAGSAAFYIDRVLVGTITTFLPSSSLDMDTVVTQQNTGATAGFMFFEHELWSS